MCARTGLFRLSDPVDSSELKLSITGFLRHFLQCESHLKKDNKFLKLFDINVVLLFA